jgi:hypothetical protein
MGLLNTPGRCQIWLQKGKETTLPGRGYGMGWYPTRGGCGEATGDPTHPTEGVPISIGSSAQ